MEIPNKVLGTLLSSMAEEELPEQDIGVEKENKTSPTPKLNRKRKVITLLSNPTTVLFSKDGKYKAIVNALFHADTDGYSYKVDVTGRIYDSNKLATNNARRWLKKKRTKYYKKHPNRKPRVKTVRIYPKKEQSPIKTINKLYPMNVAAAKILVRMSNKKLKLHKDYSRKKFDSQKTTAVSGETKDFNIAIYNVMKDGTTRERKRVAKMLQKFTAEPFRKTNMFY